METYIMSAQIGNLPDLPHGVASPVWCPCDADISTPSGRGGAQDLVVDGARGEAAEREPGRELGGVVGAQHAVARVKVGADAPRVPQVVLQPRQRRALAAHPVYCRLIRRKPALVSPPEESWAPTTVIAGQSIQLVLFSLKEAPCALIIVRAGLAMQCRSEGASKGAPRLTAKHVHRM